MNPSSNCPKDHHQLPRSYLGGFCNARLHAEECHEADSKRSRCRVWMYDKQTPPGEDPVRVRGIRNATVERHYYSLDTQDGPDPEPERALARIEGPTARIIKSLNFGETINDVSRARLAIYAVLMKFRVPAYRAWSREHAKQNVAGIRERAFPDPVTLARGLRSAGHEVAEDPAAVQKIFEDIHAGRYELQLSKNHQIQHMFENSLRPAQAFADRAWVFAWAPDETSFITSDDPVVMAHRIHGAPSSYIGPVGFASENAITNLPLRQDLMLLAMPGEKSTGHVRLSRDEVREANLMQTRHFGRWLIGRDEALVRKMARRACSV